MFVVVCMWYSEGKMFFVFHVSFSLGLSPLSCVFQEKYTFQLFRIAFGFKACMFVCFFTILL